MYLVSPTLKFFQLDTNSGLDGDGFFSLVIDSESVGDGVVIA